MTAQLITCLFVAFRLSHCWVLISCGERMNGWMDGCQVYVEGHVGGR